MATSNGRPRIVLQFNDFDFRHRKVLEILRARPRNMTDLVVNAIMHYVSCPDAGDEFGKEMVRKTVKEVLFEMMADGSISCLTPRPGVSSPKAPDDPTELVGLMDAFR